MNFNTIKQELNKKIKRMSEEDFQKFIEELERIYYEDKPHKNEVILTKEEYRKLVSNEYENGYAKGYREAIENEFCEDKEEEA